jgi:3-hydroxybutyrate dehydrogenase
MKLKDKVCIVTGAASGIGRAIAIGFAREGAKVVLADLDPALAEMAAQEIRAAGGNASSVGLDVTHENQVEAAFAGVVSLYGKIDVLVSNAGIQIVHPIRDFPFSDWKRLISTHLDGAFLTTRYCMRHMRESGNGGSIIYMGSVHSKDASIDKSAYITAKHGLIGLCKAVAKEGAADSIRANVICPGLVMTPLVERQLPALASAQGITAEAALAQLLSDTVDGKATTVQDVVDVALLFAGFSTNALTGQSLVVSHGRAMQ